MFLCQLYQELYDGSESIKISIFALSVDEYFEIFINLVKFGHSIWNRRQSVNRSLIELEIFIYCMRIDFHEPNQTYFQTELFYQTEFFFPHRTYFRTKLFYVSFG